MTLLLDVSRFRSGTDHLDRTYEPSAFAIPADDFRLTAPAHLVADLTKDAKKFRLTGRLTSALELGCSRCLEPFTIPIDAALDVLYLPEGAAAPGGGHREDDDDEEVAEDDFGVSYYKDDEIDLGELMREQFYLALPMKPLCNADCQGLCPTCGINRNRDTCGCTNTWVDPRMDALKKFRGEG